MKIDTKEKYDRKQEARRRLKAKNTPGHGETGTDRYYSADRGFKPNHAKRAVDISKVFNVLRGPKVTEGQLMDMKKAELKALMDQRGLRYTTRTTKDQMITALR